MESEAAVRNEAAKVEPIEASDPNTVKGSRTTAGRVEDTVVMPPSTGPRFTPPPSEVVRVYTEAL